MARVAMLASIMSLNRFDEPLPSTCEVTAAPVPCNAAAASLIGGAATAQVCGTDNLPTEAAPPAESADPTAATGPNWLSWPIIRASVPAIWSCVLIIAASERVADPQAPYVELSPAEPMTGDA